MRHTRFLILISALMLVLAACQAGDSGASGDGGDGGDGGEANEIDEDTLEGTVRLSGGRSSDAEEALLEETLAAFAEKYPNITVNYEPVPADYATVMAAQFSAGDPPDLFYVGATGEAAPWIEQDLLEPLGPYIEGNPEIGIDEFYPRLLAPFQRDGETYGLPKDASPLALFYNPEMLDAAGVEVPTNWEELQSAAEALTDGDVTGLCMGPEIQRWGAFIYQNGGAIYNEDNTEMTLDSPETVEALDYLLALHESGAYQTHTEIGAGWCGEAYGTGQAAMAIEGNWMVSYMENDFPDMPYEMAELPQGTQQGNLAFTVAYSMGVDSPNKDAAWVLLQYLTGQEGMGQWTSLGLALPARSDVDPAEGRDALVAGLEYATAYGFPSEFLPVQDAFNNKLTEVLASGGTGQEIVDAAMAAAR
ncbi:MAG: ABC transporter substrate-binding protein [Candidatus Limnocylindria bacterium]